MLICRYSPDCGRRAPLRRNLVRSHANERRNAGFTLLEILVTIALIAVLGTVLISGSARLLTERPKTTEDFLRKAVNDARKFAVESNLEARLTFDPKEKVFHAATTAAAQSVPVDVPGDWTVEFLSSQKGGGAMLIGGVLVETQTLNHVTFFPDGTCTPFRVQFRSAAGAYVIEFDPWTCAPILKEEAPQ